MGQVHSLGTAHSVHFTHSRLEQFQTFGALDELLDSCAGGTCNTGDGTQDHKFGSRDLERVQGQLDLDSGGSEDVSKGLSATAGIP